MKLGHPLLKFSFDGSGLIEKIKRAVKGSAVGRVLLIPYRFWFATKYFFKPWLKVFPWLFWSKETVNLTYDLSDLSYETLATFVADVASVTIGDIRSYITELNSDKKLREHVLIHTISGPMAGVSDVQVRPGKRTMYYALVRALKPKVIVEAGVDKGLGSCIIAAALMRNAEEGRPGYLYACDISPNVGFLFTSPYTSFGKRCIGDAAATFQSLTDPVDLFIQDITPGAEATLLAAIEPCLSKSGGGVALSVWHSGVMMRFAERTGRRFLVFVEETKNHWYPGAKIAVAFSHRPYLQRNAPQS